MDSYELVLSLHVLAAVIWVGGAVAMQVMAVRVVGQNDPVRLATFARDVEYIGNRTFMPAALVVVLAGAWLVYDGPWELGHTWVILALAAFAFSFLVGALYLGPTSGKAGKLIDAEGPESPEAQRLIRSLFLVSRIELGVLLLVVVDMVVKPGL